MVKNILTYLTYGKQYTSIWIDNYDGISKNYVAQGIWMNNEVEIINTFECQSTKEIITQLGKINHAYLTVTGTGVITKSIPSNIPDEKALSHTFPNIDPKQFYYTIQLQGNKKYVSVCRKPMLDKLLKEFEEQEIYFTGISLNILTLKNILSGIRKKEIQPGQFLVSVNDINIEEIKLNSSKTEDDHLIQLGEKSFGESFLVPIAGFGNYFSPYNNSNLNNLENERTKLFKEKRLFKNLIIAGVSLLLGTLLVNFLFFSSYYEEMQVLREKYQNELIRKSLIEKNRTALVRKKSMVSSILNTDNSKASLYLNRLVTSAPKNILFNSIQFQPLVTKLRQDKPVEIENKVIVVHGLTNSKVEFSQWIKNIQKYNWVSEINISDFSNQSNKQSLFGLMIKIADD